MPGALATLYVLAFAFALWLGSYLISRDPRDGKLLLAGLGLIAYGLALGLDALTQLSSQPTLLRLQWIASFLPALLWSGVLLHLVRDDGARARLTHAWTRRWLPLGLAILAVATLWLIEPAARTLRPAFALPLLVAVILLPLAIAGIRVGRDLRTMPRRALVSGSLLVLLLFALGAGLLLFPLAPLPRTLLLFVVAFDLEVLGLRVAAFDALDLGQMFARDALRSMLASFLAALLIGGQVAMAMVLATGLSAATMALLLLTVGSSLALVVFAPQLQLLLDAVAFPGNPRLRSERALLRGIVVVAPRRADPTHTAEPGGHPLLSDEAAFVRHTRHALRNHGNLSRLASNPLTGLPLIHTHLGERDGTLACPGSQAAARRERRETQAAGPGDLRHQRRVVALQRAPLPVPGRPQTLQPARRPRRARRGLPPGPRVVPHLHSRAHLLQLATRRHRAGGPGSHRAEP